jgi:aminopeptidase N
VSPSADIAVVNRFALLWSLLRGGPAVAMVAFALVATACSGSTEVAVDVRSPQMTTIVEAFLEDDTTGQLATIDSMGDPLAPGLGNGGYDVASYDLAIEWIPEDRLFASEVLITATAGEDLSELHLDFDGSIVRGVTVDGATAEYLRDEAEIIITPATPIAVDTEFQVTVEYLTDPVGASARSELTNGQVGWIETSDPAWYARSAPDGAHLWVPSNDHPSDAAVFATQLTVPDGTVAVASGAFGREQRGIGRMTTRWETSAPIPTHAMTVILGDFVVVEDARGSDASGVDIRHLLPPDLASDMPAVLHKADDMILFLEQRLGRFPYDAWGVAVVSDSAAAKPANSWTIMSRADLDADDVELRMMRDLASHYFGHAVGIESWSDIWISEAIPTYVQWLWLQGSVGRSGLDVTIAAARAKVNNAAWPAPDEPRLGDVYVGSGALHGALFLHALSLRIGQSDFFEVISTAYREYAGAAMSTEDFMRLTEEVTGDKIRAFADAWFHRDPLPGFPDA